MFKLNYGSIQQNVSKVVCGSPLQNVEPHPGVIRKSRNEYMVGLFKMFLLISKR